MDSMDTNATTSSSFPSRFTRTPSSRPRDGLGLHVQGPKHLAHR
jgi:hypothetical protein